MVSIIIKVCATMLVVVSITVPRIKTCAQRYIKYIPNFQRPLSPNFFNIFRDLNRIQTLLIYVGTLHPYPKHQNNQCKQISWVFYLWLRTHVVKSVSSFSRKPSFKVILILSGKINFLHLFEWSFGWSFLIIIDRLPWRSFWFLRRDN